MADEEPKAPLTADAKKKKQKVIGYAALAVGVVGALIAWLAYRNSKSSSSSTTTTAATPTTSATGTAGTGTVAGYTSDGSQSSYDQAIVQALSAIQSSIGTPSGEQTGAEQYATTNFSGESPATLGYYFPGLPASTVVSTGSSLYTGFSSLGAAQAYQGTEYYQPSPGTFSAATPGMVATGVAPLYQQIPSLPAGLSVYNPSA